MFGATNTKGEDDLKSSLRRSLHTAAIVTGLIAVIPLVWFLASIVDRRALGAAWDAALRQPLTLTMVLVSFSAAFAARAFAWRSLLPQLPFGQALSAIHVSLGANHLLPLRLGEPLRILSVVRRAGVPWGPATASTVALRAADVAAIGVVGAVVGLGRVEGRAALWAVVGIAIAAGSGAIVWLSRLRAGSRVRLPGPLVLLATVAAWLLESVVAWQSASWVGIDITFTEAILVTAAAVVAQVVAITPGGLGTYEAGGTAALVLLGHDPATALAAVITAHAVKTAYSLLAGAVAAFLPAPGLLGRLRLAPIQELAPASGRPPPGAPIVMFFPAYDEEATVATVIARTPREVKGHPVHCLVIDDGSSDATAEEAARAGAMVLRQPANRGLGAAVRRGLSEALALQPAAVAFCDADGEYAPEELDRLVAPILDGDADYVVGSRFSGDIERMLPHRRLGNRVLTLALSWIARRRISDGQSGYRAFSPRAAAAADVIHDFNYAQVLTLDLLAKGVRYREVPISYSFRTSGTSFVRLGSYLRAVVPAVYRELNTA